MFFEKSLTTTDVQSKLTVTNGDFFRNSFSSQGKGQGQDTVDFMVRNQSGQIWTFRLSIMRTRPDRIKHFISAGWLQFARDKGLESGDHLTIYKDGSNDKMYRIEVKRRKNNEGSDEWNRLV